MTREKQSPRGWLGLAGLGMVVTGVSTVLVASLGFFSGPSTSSWSDETAGDYAEAGLQLHSLSFAPPTEENQEKLAAAERQYLRLREQLDDARESGPRLTQALLWGGAAMTVAGGVLVLAGRSR